MFRLASVLPKSQPFHLCCRVLSLCVRAGQDYSSPSAFHQAVLRHVAASLQLPCSHFTLQSHLDYFSPCVASSDVPSASLAVQSDLVSTSATSESTSTLSAIPPPSPGDISVCKLGETAALPASHPLQSTGSHPAARVTDSDDRNNVIRPLSTSSFISTHPKFHRPHPLNVSTASQLGLLRSLPRQGNSMASTAATLVPPLHMAALPPGSPVTAGR